MSSGFATPITIKDAIDKIVTRNYLIPAIQRKFVWSSDKVETLFDSIMRGYSIITFMLRAPKSLSSNARISSRPASVLATIENCLSKTKKFSAKIGFLAKP